MTTLQQGRIRRVQDAAGRYRGSHKDETGGVNVGGAERAASAALGLPLIALGLRRGTFGGLALAAAGGMLAYRAATGHCKLYEALNIDSAHGAVAPDRGVFVEKTFTVNRTPEECYKVWHDFENLPRFMTHLKSVRVLDGRRSRWEAKAPLGASVSWDAEVVSDRPNEEIRWRSVGDADVANAGSVRFRPAPGGRGTEVSVEMHYAPPAGRLGATVAWLLGEEPDLQVREDLRHFKEVMEAGEIPTVKGQPSCRGRG
jgi:uncharacterized membrane protein